MFSRPSTLLIAAPVVLSILSGCASVKPPPTAVETKPMPAATSTHAEAKAASVPPPTAPLLLQPELHWKGKESTFQGTAFLVQARERLVAITSSHYLDLSGPALESVTLWGLTGASDTPLAELTHSWGIPGTGGIGSPILDLRDDQLLLPLASAPPGITVLKLSQRLQPELGERVWFPNKVDGQEPGYELIEGEVIDVDSAFILVQLDRPFEGQSQSGSPILSQRDGSVLGTFSRGDGEGELLQRLYLTPALELLARLTGSDDHSLPLSTTVPGGLSAASDQPLALSFAWPDQTEFKIKKTKFRNELGKPLSAGKIEYFLHGTKRADGYSMRLHDPSLLGDPLPEEVQSLYSAMPEMTFKVSPDGTFQELEDAQEAFNRVMTAMEKAQAHSKSDTTAHTNQQELNRKLMSQETLTYFAGQYWSNLVGGYAGGQFVPEQVFEVEQEQTIPLFGGFKAHTLIQFAVLPHVPCSERDTSRGCVEINLLTSVDQASVEQGVNQLLKLAAQSGKSGKDLPKIHFDAYLQRNRLQLTTHASTLLPTYLRTDKQIRIEGTFNGESAKMARWELEEEAFTLTAAP